MPQHVTPYPTAAEINAAAFWRNVDQSGDCWLWLAGTDGKGYGVFVHDGRLLLAHRVAYLLHNGSIDLRHVLHSCDVTRCCNPAHLAMGSHLQNMQEAAERNRFPRRFGASNHNAKLTQEQAEEMRALFVQGANKSQLSRRFGVSCPVVRKILRGDAYPVK